MRGADRGELWQRTRQALKGLAPMFQLCESIDAFKYMTGRDLTGYEDGTENPTGDAAVQAAFAMLQGPGLDGSSFAAVQVWEHDLEKFESLPQRDQDYIIGRRKQDNEEIGAAPATAHIKRTAQEDFEPAAFILRRSMPWVEAPRSGLVFLAFGNSFDPFEALLNRMAGKDDGILDALFSFTRPLTGSYFWCPPMHNGKLDLSILGY
jgi:putative iron-dependent peroxidase